MNSILKIKPVVLRTLILLISGAAPGTLTAQTEEPKQDLTQYLFPSFAKGTVLTKAGRKNTLVLNYNTVTEKMVFEQKGNYYDIANPDQSDTAYLQERKFIPHKDFFLEVLMNERISFYIQHKGELVAPARPAGYGQTSQLTSSNYLNGVQNEWGYFNFKLPDGYTVRPTPVYWINRNGTMHSFLGEKQYLKIFPEYSEAIRKFIKKEKLKFDRLSDIEKIVRFTNDML